MEYLISKLTFKNEGGLIDNVFCYEWDGQTLLPGKIENRDWLVNKVITGGRISAISPREEKSFSWERRGEFVYNNGLFEWPMKLPLNSTRRKTFVCYYHKDDQIYKQKFANLFGDLVICKSVESGDIDSNNSHEYIKQLIQKDYLADTTVIVVLIGKKTKCRMQVDWEISGALNLKVGEIYAGVLGVLLPTHPNFHTGTANHILLPARLADNFNSGYAIVRDWTTDRVLMQSYINQAFLNRTGKSELRINSREQMSKNTCE